MTAVDTLIRDIFTTFAPPTRTTPSAWAEANRILAPEASAEAGPWKNDRTPYLQGFMNAVVEDGVQEIVFCKGSQIGGSEALRNIIGYWVDSDPSPLLLILPDEKSTSETIRERLLPMIRSSPALARHLSDRRQDNTLQCVKLDSMPIYVGWSGSPQSLASRPCRYVVFDECDKFADFIGVEGDAISLGEERTKTYLHRAKRMKVSTPTIRTGPIWKSWSACGDKRHYFVPCPHCGHYQRLVWSQVKFAKIVEAEKSKRADAILAGGLAWYECIGCKSHITDGDKPAMLSRGQWLSEGQSISPSGAVDGHRPRSPRVGFHLSSLYSPWIRFADIVAKFILCEGDPGATMNFRNSWLAEPDEQIEFKIRGSLIREKMIRSRPPLIVPSWAGSLFASADTQKDHFFFTIRAWGYGFRSALVHCGIAQTFAELYRITLESTFTTEAGLAARPHVLLIDSGGNRTDEVYEFAAKDPGRIFPCKGASHVMRKPNFVSKVGTAGVQLWILDTAFYKDMLARLITGQLDAGDGTMIDQWQVHNQVTEDYILQMSSEHKCRDRKTGKLLWLPVSSGAANHFFDCEVLQVAAADISNVGILRPPAPPPPRAETTERRRGDLLSRDRDHGALSWMEGGSGR